MGIAQELLQQSDYQELQNKDIISAELTKFESSLDRAKIEAIVKGELSAERSSLNKEDKEEQINLKIEEILQQYIEYRKEGTLQTFLKQAEHYLSDLQTQGELQNEQAEILKENHYSYFDLVKDNTTLYNQIANQIAISDKTTFKTEQDKEKAVEERCDKIEDVWFSYISGSLDVALPEETLGTMATGFAIKLTSWLKTSHIDAGAVAKSASGMTEGGLGAALPKLFSVFGKIGGFAEIMGMVNNAVKAINTHGTQISTTLNSKEPTPEKIALEKIFNTPQGFYDWLNGSLAVKQPNNPNLTFETSFVQFKGSSDRKSMAGIISKLNYTPGVHALMDKVIHEGKGVLDLRNEAKDNVDVIFDQVQSMISSTGGLFGHSVTEILEDMGLKGVADFVCLLLGYGSVSGMEKKYRSKNLDTEFTSDEKKSLDSVVAYAKRYMADTSYSPTTHDDSGSFLNQVGLKKTIESYMATPDTKAIDLTVFPTSPDLVIDSFIAGFDKGVVPDPTILSSIPKLKGYTTTSKDKDGNQIVIIDPNQEQELHKQLKDPKFVQQIVATVAGRYTDPVFLARFSETPKDGPAKGPSDYIGLLYTTCVAPTNAMKAREFDVIDRLKIGGGIVVGGLVGLGAQKAADIAQRAAADTPAPSPANETPPAATPPAAPQEQAERPSENFDTALTDFIKKHEGFSATSRRDYAQYSRGYGTKAPGKDMTISEADAVKELEKVIADNKKTITTYISQLGLQDKVKGSRLIAILSIAYNAGPGNAKKVLEKIKSSSSDQEVVDFIKNFAIRGSGSDKILPGLVKRRAEEAQLYLENKEYSSEAPSSLELPLASLSPETTIFGDSNAERFSYLTTEGQHRTGVKSCQGCNTTELKTKTSDIQRTSPSLIMSTVNNGYSKTEEAQKAADDMIAIGQKCKDGKGSPVFVLLPNPTNRSDKRTNPNRYATFQDYNTIVKQEAQKNGWQILDFSQQTDLRDTDGYHIKTSVLAGLMKDYQKPASSSQPAAMA